MNIKETLKQLRNSQQDIVALIDSSLRKVKDFDEDIVMCYITGGEDELNFYRISYYDIKTKTISLDANYDTFTRKLEDLDFYELLLLANECMNI